jgi:hypothetical protein
MKKKIFAIILALFIISLHAFADEKDEFDTGFDAFQNRRDLKPVSEDDVQRILKELEARKAKKMSRFHKKAKKKKMKGDPLTKSADGGSSSSNVVPVPYFYLQIPQNLASGNTLIPLGFYTVDFDHKNNNLLLKQGYKILGIVPMRQTTKEPENSQLYYVKATPQPKGVQFLYGEIDKHYEGFCPFVY